MSRDGIKAILIIFFYRPALSYAPHLSQGQPTLSGAQKSGVIPPFLQTPIKTQ